MHLSGTATSANRSRQLRKEMSKPERLLWWALKNEQRGVRFRRSHPAGPYILDFYCASANLCVEVDGGSHDFRAVHDARRDEFLRRVGVRTLRVSARAVLRNLAGVVAAIDEALQAPSDLPSAGHLPQVPGGGA